MTARKPAPAEEFVPDADVSESPAGWEWDTVSEEAATRVILDTIGDEFIGMYLGTEHIKQEMAADGSDPSFDQFLFKGRDGEKYAIYESYDLKEAMEKVEGGRWVRIRYMKDVKTGRNLNPMKSFRVDVRK